MLAARKHSCKDCRHPHSSRWWPFCPHPYGCRRLTLMPNFSHSGANKLRSSLTCSGRPLVEPASGAWQGGLGPRGCNRPIISYYLCIELTFTNWVSTGLLWITGLFRSPTAPPSPSRKEQRWVEDCQEMMICCKWSFTKLLTCPPAMATHWTLDSALKPHSVAAWQSNWMMRWVLNFSTFVVLVARNQSPSYRSVF